MSKQFSSLCILNSKPADLHAVVSGPFLFLYTIESTIGKWRPWSHPVDMSADQGICFYWHKVITLYGPDLDICYWLMLWGPVLHDAVQAIYSSMGEITCIYTRCAVQEICPYILYINRVGLEQPACTSTQSDQGLLSYVLQFPLILLAVKNQIRLWKCVGWLVPFVAQICLNPL